MLKVNTGTIQLAFKTTKQKTCVIKKIKLLTMVVLLMQLMLTVKLQTKLKSSENKGGDAAKAGKAGSKQAGKALPKNKRSLNKF